MKIDANVLFDVRDIPCSVKHGMILQRWQATRPGQHFVLVNGHDPLPLYYQFSAVAPGEFDWEYVERSETCVAVRISRHPEGVRRPPSFVPGADAGRRTCDHMPAVNDASALEVDARGLEPPEPMMRILSAIDRLGDGQALRALTDRRPVHLLADLQNRGFDAACEEQADGSWLTLLKRS